MNIRWLAGYSSLSCTVLLCWKRRTNESASALPVITKLLGARPRRALKAGDHVRHAAMCHGHGTPRRVSPHVTDACMRSLWCLPRSRASGYPSNDKIAEANRQINEVKGIMQDNIEKAIRREDNLQHLNDKTGAQPRAASGRTEQPPAHVWLPRRCDVRPTEELAASSYQFKRNATTLKKQMWWKNIKFTIMLSVICVVILILVIGTWCSRACPCDMSQRTYPAWHKRGHTCCSRQ